MDADGYMTCPNCGGGGGFEDGLCMVCTGYGKATQEQIDERWDGTSNFDEGCTCTPDGVFGDGPCVECEEKVGK